MLILPSYTVPFGGLKELRAYRWQARTDQQDRLEWTSRIGWNGPKYKCWLKWEDNKFN